MQAARALELRRDQEAYQLLAPAILPTLADTTAARTAQPHEARGLVIFAHACLRTMRTTKGVQATTRAIALDPKDPEARWVRAYLDQRRFRNVAAIASAKEAVRLAPGDPRYQLALGELSLGGGMVGTPDFAQAETALREVLRLQPENGRARFLLGKTLVLSGKHALGEALLDSLLTEDESAEARTLRGLARMRKRDFAGAAEDFHRATLLDPTDSMAWFNASLAFERQGKTDDAAAARAEFERSQQFGEALHPIEIAYHSNSENLDAGLELATQLRRAGHLHQARILLETWALDRPDDPRASIFLSEIAADEGLLEPAQKAARRALEIAPDHPRALVALSNALASSDAQQAVSLARRAVEVAPRAAPAHVALARRLLDSGDAGGALREFQLARQLVPDDESLLGSAGVAMVHAGAWEDAEPLLSAAIAKEGPHSEWLLYRGLAREGMNNTEKAIEDLRSAIEVDPAGMRAYEELARVLRSTNRNAQADSVQREAAKIAKSEEEIHKLKQMLWEDPYNDKPAHHLAKLLREERRPDEASRVLAASLEAVQEP